MNPKQPNQLGSRQGNSPHRKPALARRLAGWLTGIWVWGLAQTAWAGVLIYEPFAYPTGQQLSLTGTADPLTLPTPTTTQWDRGVGFTSGSEWGIGRADTATTITTGIGPASL
ncbi:MAG: hypothetical protein NZ602_05325 [Thermoguttaceae bacterium]|nr:hypothetical protein [Thermoguttaceae bacterium]MDW8036464.1 hypothetical protein [Thermoguttaceae bacterium]